jgi:hypothetical protein
LSGISGITFDASSMNQRWSRPICAPRRVCMSSATSGISGSRSPSAIDCLAQFTMSSVVRSLRPEAMTRIACAANRKRSCCGRG